MDDLLLVRQKGHGCFASFLLDDQSPSALVPVCAPFRRSICHRHILSPTKTLLGFKSLLKIKKTILMDDLLLVRQKGLEPPRRRHQNLNLARLPIPPLAQNGKENVKIKRSFLLYIFLRKPSRNLTAFLFLFFFEHMFVLHKIVNAGIEGNQHHQPDADL